jgi:hypothetical protein
MTAEAATCSPGSHTHSDRPNWRPAETVDEYVINCREGLENYSERRMATLLGMSRVHLWRAARMAELPDDLFERLLAAGVRSTKALAAVAHMLAKANNVAEVERCPHCGEVLRVRKHINVKAIEVVRQWLADRGAA